MSNFNLKNILEFTELLNAFNDTERVNYRPKCINQENDVEHSYQLAMLAWYISDNISPNLNKHLILKYALVHDLVEVYAGDTYLYSEDQNDHNSKHEREESARLKLIEKFPLFKDLHATILQYEKREDEESKFIYVLDKIHPMLHSYLDNGRMWKEHNVTFAMVLAKKKSKMQIYPDLLPIWDEIEKALSDNEDTLFPKH